MDMLEAVKARHSVREYTDKAIEGDVLTKLQQAIDAANSESGLRMQLVLNQPDLFTKLNAQYGKFSNVRNCIAMVGPKGDDLEETIGYYGERVVLEAQCMGLNTCWMAFSYRSSGNIVQVASDEDLVLAVAVGYGANQGTERRRKPIEMLCTIDGFHPSSPQEIPDWFAAGLRAATLAPTCVHQQEFCMGIADADSRVVTLEPGTGRHTLMDMGIAELHFELGANSVSTDWEWA